MCLSCLSGEARKGSSSKCIEVINGVPRRDCASLAGDVVESDVVGVGSHVSDVVSAIAA